jgi:N-acetylneuraminic acid mutarotase
VAARLAPAPRFGGFEQPRLTSRPPGASVLRVFSVQGRLAPMSLQAALQAVRANAAVAAACAIFAGLGCEGGASQTGESAASGKDPAMGRWESLPPMPQPRFYVGVAAARDRVFVVGGLNDAEAKTVHVFDTKAKTWAATKPLPIGFKVANAVGVGDRFFVLGGLERSEAVEYDFAADDWLMRSPLPVQGGRAGSAVGVWGKTVILAGGVLRGSSANALNTGIRKAEAFAYDTETDSWQMLPEMPLENGYAMGAMLGDDFWVIGGSTNFARTDQVLVLNLKTKAWTTRPPIPKSLSSGAVGVLGGRVFVTGGIATSVGMISPDTMVLDPATGEWSLAPPLPTARFAMGGAVVGGKFYVPTGMAAAPGPAMFAASGEMEAFSF